MVGWEDDGWGDDDGDDDDLERHHHRKHRKHRHHHHRRRRRRHGRVFLVNATAIWDQPRFAHRGLLVDTGRHFLPVPALLVRRHCCSSRRHASKDAPLLPCGSALAKRCPGARLLGGVCGSGAAVQQCSAGMISKRDRCCGGLPGYASALPAAASHPQREECPGVEHSCVMSAAHRAVCSVPTHRG